jgi:hypothetical protein
MLCALEVHLLHLHLKEESYSQISIKRLKKIAIK